MDDDFKTRERHELIADIVKLRKALYSVVKSGENCWRTNEDSNDDVVIAVSAYLDARVALGDVP